MQAQLDVDSVGGSRCWKIEISLDVNYRTRSHYSELTTFYSNKAVEDGSDVLIELGHKNLEFYKEQQARANKAEERVNRFDLISQNLLMRSNRDVLECIAKLEELVDNIDELEHAQ